MSEMAGAEQAPQAEQAPPSPPGVTASPSPDAETIGQACAQATAAAAARTRSTMRQMGHALGGD